MTRPGAGRSCTVGRSRAKCPNQSAAPSARSGSSSCWAVRPPHNFPTWRPSLSLSFADKLVPDAHAPLASWTDSMCCGEAAPSPAPCVRTPRSRSQRMPLDGVLDTAHADRAASTSSGASRLRPPAPLGGFSLPERHRGPLLALQVRDSVESGYFPCIIDRRRGSEASSSARSPTSRRGRSQRRDASSTPRSPSGILHRDALRRAKERRGDPEAQRGAGA
jgi:hypothetical protein